MEAISTVHNKASDYRGRIILPRAEVPNVARPVQALLLLSFVFIKVASLLQVVGVLCAQHRQRLLAHFHQLATAQQERSLAYNSFHQFKHGGRGRPTRRFWTRPGRSEAWWSLFFNNLVLPKMVWKFSYDKKKFHETVLITKAVFTKARYQHAQGLKRRKQVAITLYYLSDKGRYRKVANAFGVARSTVSKVVRRVYFVISKE